MMWFILNNIKEPKNAYIAKTIVTTELVDDMAKAFKIDCYNTLTGFKYIAELIGALENNKKFIAAGEESYGYMVGDFVRDKDAVSACAFFAAMAAAAKDENCTLFDWLLNMYTQYSFYKEGLVNLVRKGAEGEQQIKTMMEKFRNAPPATIIGQKIVSVLDYKLSEETNKQTGAKTPLALAKSDVLQFYLEDGSKISVRPSGTEPKIKFYISVKSNLKDKSDFELVNTQLEAKITAIEKEITQ